MNKIEQLIEELCPQGVEFRALGEVCKIETGKLNANAAVDDGEYMFFTTAKEPSKIDRYRWDTEALMIAGNANVGEVKHYIGKFEAYQRTYVLTNFSEAVDVRFLFFSLSDNLKKYLENHTNSAAMTYIVLSTLQNFLIPIPPLAIQKEIVKILDNFTRLEAELEAELEARKKQYEYYRDELLSFGGDVKWKALGEVATIQRGKRLVKSQLEKSGNYAVYQNSMTPLGYYHESNVKSDTTFIISAGAAGEIGYSDTDFWAADDVYFFLTPDNVESKFLYYFLLTQQNRILAQVRRASIPRLSKKVVEKLQFPIPPLSKQKEIVAILDKFDALVNDISTGLPAEITARKKQYEYYRNQLLTFKPVGADNQRINNEI